MQGPRLKSRGRLQHGQQEMLHSKQLGSIKMPIDSTHGIYRDPCSCPASDKLARGAQTRSTQCPEQQHRMRSP